MIYPCKVTLRKENGGICYKAGATYMGEQISDDEAVILSEDGLNIPCYRGGAGWLNAFDKPQHLPIEPLEIRGLCLSSSDPHSMMVTIKEDHVVTSVTLAEKAVLDIHMWTADWLAILEEKREGS